MLCESVRIKDCHNVKLLGINLIHVIGFGGLTFSPICNVLVMLQM